MALVIPEGDALVLFKHRMANDSEDMLCILGIEMPPDFDNANGQAAVNDLFTKWSTNMKPIVSLNVTFTGAELLRKDADGFITFVSNVAGVVGTSAGVSVPCNTAYLVHKTTNRGGRSGRGRMFVPGAPESEVDGAGNITSVMLAQITTALNNTYTALSTATSVDDIKLFHQDTIVNTTPTNVTGFVIDPKVASQRRRMRR